MQNHLINLKAHIFMMWLEAVCRCETLDASARTGLGRVDMRCVFLGEEIIRIYSSPFQYALFGRKSGGIPRMLQIEHCPISLRSVAFKAPFNQPQLDSYSGYL